MKIHSYQVNNPRYDAPTAKITSWFGLVTKEYYHRTNRGWFSCETGEECSDSRELYLYGILQNKMITAKGTNKHMNTLEKLNAHLATEVTKRSGYSIKARSPHIRCEDGVTLSVQASNFHYSTPDDNVGPYTKVEVWCVNGDYEVAEFEYSEDYPSSYVPIELVVEFINRHGGFAEKALT